jgi:hypothetical protein
VKLRHEPIPGACSISRCKSAPDYLIELEPLLDGLIEIKRIPYRKAYPDGARVCEKHVPPQDRPALLPQHTLPVVSVEAAMSILPTMMVEAEIAANVLHAETSIALAKEVRIETAEEFALFAELLTETKAKLKRLVEQRETITAPLRTALENARALFRPGETVLSSAETAIKAVLGDFTRREQNEKAKRLAEAAAASQRGDVEATRHALARVVNTKNAAPNVSARNVWTVVSIDPDMIPIAYRMPDEKKIAAYARSHDPTKTPEIPGVVFKLDTIISSRGAT